MAYVVRRLRQAWPGVRIHLRGDSGLGTPTMYQACEQLEIDYTLGIGMNATLKKWTDSLLETAVAQWERTGQTQRLFTAFWCRAESWTVQRWGVVKCEAHAEGANRRAVVTNRPGAKILPGAAYADRGESENRNKELKRGLQADRLSDHRYFANLFRRYLHTAPTTSWFARGRSSPIRRRSFRGKNCPTKPSLATSVAAGTIDAAITTPWGKASLAPGVPGSSRWVLTFAKPAVACWWNSRTVGRTSPDIRQPDRSG